MTRNARFACFARFARYGRYARNERIAHNVRNARSARFARARTSLGPRQGQFVTFSNFLRMLNADRRPITVNSIAGVG